MDKKEILKIVLNILKYAITLVLGFLGHDIANAAGLLSGHSFIF